MQAPPSHMTAQHLATVAVLVVSCLHVQPEQTSAAVSCWQCCLTAWLMEAFRYTACAAHCSFDSRWKGYPAKFPLFPHVTGAQLRKNTTLLSRWTVCPASLLSLVVVQGCLHSGSRVPAIHAKLEYSLLLHLQWVLYTCLRVHCTSIGAFCTVAPAV
jgi:hypothetical protein